MSMTVSKRIGRAIGVCGLWLGLLMVAGCQTALTRNPAVELPAAGSNEVFRIGDPVTVTFSDTPQTIPRFEERVKEDGTITLLWNEPFDAAGKTPGELENEIRARYVPSRFENLTVTIKFPTIPALESR